MRIVWRLVLSISILPMLAASADFKFPTVTPEDVAWRDVPNGKGLQTAIISGDPVVFLEPKSLYEAKPSRSYYPGPDYRVPLGTARIAREGTDLTIVTYGNLWPRSMAAADKLATEHGISAICVSPAPWRSWRSEAVCGLALMGTAC